jgi:hypothetical protein
MSQRFRLADCLALTLTLATIDRHALRTLLCGCTHDARVATPLVAAAAVAAIAGAAVDLRMLCATVDRSGKDTGVSAWLQPAARLERSVLSD